MLSFLQERRAVADGVDGADALLQLGRESFPRDSRYRDDALGHGQEDLHVRQRRFQPQK